MSTRRTEFLAGAKAELPILLGVMPFGMIYGVLALGAGLSPAAALAMSSIVFAGSSQMIGAQLFATAAPGIVIVLTTFVVNLRHMLYSASIAPHVKHLRSGWKWLLAYLLTDEAYAVTIAHYTRPESATPPRDASQIDRQQWYFLGAGLALWTTWQISSAVGIFLGAQIPDNWSLDFTLALTFIGLVVPPLKDRPGAAAAISASIVAVLAADLPFKLGLMIAALTGILVGLWLERSASKALPLRRDSREAP